MQRHSEIKQQEKESNNSSSSSSNSNKAGKHSGWQRGTARKAPPHRNLYSKKAKNKAKEKKGDGRDEAYHPQ